MSGFEVVGIVLGSIPLMISVLEHYSDGVSRFKSMAQYENVFIDSQARLLLSIATFEQSCRELLKDFSDSQIYGLVDLRQGWDDLELAGKLQQRLGKNFTIYRVSVKQLNKRIELLRKKLDLREDLTAPFIKDGKIDEKLWKSYFRWKRVRGGFNAERYKKLIDDIRADVDQICNFTKGAMENRQVGVTREQVQGLQKRWLSMRDHSHKLYDVLHDFWTQRCSSHTHRTNIQVDSPGDDENDNETPRLSCSFLSECCQDLIKPQPCYWRSTILLFQRPSPPLRPDTDTSVLFTPLKETRCQIPTVTIDEELYRVSRHSCTSATEIDDLCGVLSRDTKGKCCLGFLNDNEWSYHFHDAIRPSQNLHPLREVVYSQRKTTRQKRIIALALASGVLQLHDTPWLQEMWTVDDVYFDSDQGDLKLYVCKTFAPDRYIKQDSCAAITPERLLYKNCTLFALAVALLELNYGEPISAMKTDQDLEDAFTPYRTAARLTERVQQDELERFATAVSK